MTTAADTNVLLDILSRDPAHYESSVILIHRALQDGEVIVGEVVVAELARRFKTFELMVRYLSELGVEFEPSSGEALHTAGMTFQRYLMQRGGVRCSACGVHIDTACPRCGSPQSGRQHILADFMIGAHALVHAGRLLTRDRGYYRNYFPGLVLV